MKLDNIVSEVTEIGMDVFIHPSAVIRGINGKSKRIYIGDHSYIGQDVQIICDDFSIGDYSKIHHHTNIHGYKPCHIGHNAWIGQYTIIDSIGGVNIGNNCGIGAHSQLWSHIKYGDTLEGCRFKFERPLNIGNDVWFVGHCIVSPIIAADRSMALAGSVVTRDMEFNTIYAGTPARSLSPPTNKQFTDISTDEKINRMNELLSEWNGDRTSIIIVTSDENMDPYDDKCYFNICDRTYTKKHLKQEIELMKFLLPDKAKFIPYVCRK